MENIEIPTKDNIDNQFREIAEKLILNSVLIVDDNEIYFNELEVYLYSDYHIDPFVHKHPKQKNYCSWYFHESGNGVDLTFDKRDPSWR